MTDPRSNYYPRFTTAQVVDRLGLHRHTIYEYISKGYVHPARGRHFNHLGATLPVWWFSEHDVQRIEIIWRSNRAMMAVQRIHPAGVMLDITDYAPIDPVMRDDDDPLYVPSIERRAEQLEAEWNEEEEPCPPS